MVQQIFTETFFRGKCYRLSRAVYIIVGLSSVMLGLVYSGISLGARFASRYVPTIIRAGSKYGTKSAIRLNRSRFYGRLSPFQKRSLENLGGNLVATSLADLTKKRKVKSYTKKLNLSTMPYGYYPRRRYRSYRRYRSMRGRYSYRPRRYAYRRRY